MLGETLASAGADLVPVSRPSQVLLSDVSALLIQWPDQIFWQSRSIPQLVNRALAEISGLLRWKRAGAKLIWIVHNSVPHDRSPTELLVWRLYSRRLARIVDGYMTLSVATRASVLREHPGLEHKPFAAFPHPAYRNVRRDAPTIARRRRELGVHPGEILVAAVGMIADYKGIPELVAAFREARREDWRLMIAGRRKSPEAQAMVEALLTDLPAVICDIRELTDDEFAEYVAASDRLVAPYRNYLHSGSLVYALSAARMVLTPSMPFAESLAAGAGQGWIHLYDPPLTAEILERFVNSPVPATEPDLTELSGPKGGQIIVDFIRKL
jgi:glycosyltransferase involved in cell wall biosynthesis